MATKEYIVALEISTSKIQGAVGINGYDGTTIIAYAHEPVKGFITKGVVRNIDETGRCISNVINSLEEQLGGESIEKAYISINGQSVKSIKTSIVTEFPEYTKITPYIIDKMAIENDEAANIPDDYQKIQVITQEYKLGGDPCLTPIGMSVNRIEGNYINIIVKNQYMRQLEESLTIAKVEIADSFTAAKITAEELLTDNEKRDGCALVDIGADTTTLTLYSNSILRSLCVLPIGSATITRDLAAEHISYEDAETLKKHAGYKHSAHDNSSIIKKELLDKIISARMAEILQNINHRIKNSNEKIIHAVFTGGGSHLRNIEQLIAENLPGIRMRLATNPLAEFSINNEHKHKSEISPILIGLIKNGKQNCCQEQQYTTHNGMQEIFPEEEFSPIPIEETNKETRPKTTAPKEEISTNTEPEEETNSVPVPNNKKKHSKINRKTKLAIKKISKTFKNILNGTMTYVDNATKTEDEVNFDDNPTENK